MARFCFGEFLNIMTNNIVPHMSQEATANHILKPLLNSRHIGKEDASKLKDQKLSVWDDIIDLAGDQPHRDKLIAYFKDTIKLHIEKEEAVINAICKLLNADTAIPAKKRNELLALSKKDSYSDFLAYTLLYALSIENNLAKHKENLSQAKPIKLSEGIQNFLSIELKNHIANTVAFSESILPDVIDIDSWLGGVRTDFINAVKMLWDCEIWDCVFYGGSGTGKSTAFLACAQSILKNKLALPIYIELQECFQERGDRRILTYIQRHYAPDVPVDDIEHFLLSPRNKSSKPDVILLIDGLSDCCSFGDCDESITVLQNEFLLLNRPHIQLIFSATNEVHPFTLGKISRQAFNIQQLTKEQIQKYLKTKHIGYSKLMPISALANPFMLTIYAQTEEFLASQRGQQKKRFRANTCTEADILYNFFEAVTVKHIEKAKQSEKSKISFVFDFILPKIAFYMVSNVRYHISKSEIDMCSKDIVELLKNNVFITAFDEHYGKEDYIYDVNYLIACFVQQTGILVLSGKGYTFGNELFRDFLCAKHVYNTILMQSNTTELCSTTTEALESHSLTYQTRKYLGELCEEYQNKPYSNDFGEWIFPNKKRLLSDLLDVYRENFSDQTKIAVANIVATMAICRQNDLSGVNLSNLDLRRITFANIVCSRKTKNGYVAAKFSGCYIDQWFFKTVQYSKDRSSVKFLKKENKIVATTGSGKIAIFNCVGDKIGEIATNDDFVQSIDVSPDENSLLISCLNTGIYKYDFDSNCLTCVVEPYGILFGAARFLSADSIAYCMRDKKVFIYDVVNAKKVCEINYSANSFCYDDERNTLVLASRAREVVCYNLEKRSFERRHSTLDISDSYIMQTKLYSDIDTIIGCTKDGAVIEWNSIRTAPTVVYRLDGEINDFVLSDDLSKIYCISENNGLYIIDRCSKHTENYLINEPGRWTAISIKDNLLALTSVEGGAVLFDIATLKHKIISAPNSCYQTVPLHIKGCSFRNVVFNGNISREFMLALEEAGAIFSNMDSPKG